MKSMQKHLPVVIHELCGDTEQRLHRLELSCLRRKFVAQPALVRDEELDDEKIQHEHPRRTHQRVARIRLRWKR